MAIEVEDLTSLDVDEVQQNLEELTARVQEAHPELDLTRGPLHDLLLYTSAVLQTASQTNIDRYRRSSSIREIELDPTLADDDVVDNAFSNWGVTRLEGEFARGLLTIVVSANTTVTIGQGAIFQANGKQFAADQSYVAKSEAGQVNDASDRLFQTLSDGNYAFTIEVTAVEEGTSSRLTKDSAVIPVVQPLNFVRAYATSDFGQARDTETNAQTLARLQEGQAARTLSGFTTMQGLLRSLFEDVQVSSVVGAGDAEMIRDAHTIWPGSLGGCMDWYVRSQLRVEHRAATVEAVLVEITSDGTVWQFPLGRDEAPGFYEVRNIRPSGNVDLGGFEILADTRTIDLTGDGYRPDIQSVLEGAFSRFQAATIQFLDTLTDSDGLTIGDTAEYDIEIVLQPDIDEMQDLLASRDHRPPPADLLIKAAVPCFLSLSFTVRKYVGEADPDTENIALALCETVNRTGFTGRLSASTFQDVIHGFLDGNSRVSLVDMFGRIRTPEGDDLYIRDSEELEVPDRPEILVTAQTVQFFLDPEDVAISIETAGPRPL